jgi:hypothetical protein
MGQHLFRQLITGDVRLHDASDDSVVAHWKLYDSADASLDGYPALDCVGGYHGAHVGCAGGSGEGVDAEVAGISATLDDKMWFDGVDDTLYNYVMYLDSDAHIRSLFVNGAEVWTGDVTASAISSGNFVVGSSPLLNGIAYNIGIPDTVEMLGNGTTSADWADFSTLKSLAFSSSQSLPDGQASDAGKGFTITGLAYDPSGFFWASNFGDNIEPIGAPYAPALIKLSLDGTTILQEIDISSVIGTDAGIQGIAYDSSDDTLWVCEGPGHTVWHLTTSGTLIGSFESTHCNGIAYDSLSDTLWILNTNSVFKNYTKEGVEIQEYPCFIPAPDMLTYDADRDAIWATGGSNGSDGKVYIFYKDKGWARQITTSGNTESIEGIVVLGDKVYLGNDGYYHNTDTTNTLQIYDLSESANSNNGTVNGSPVTVGQKRKTILQTAGEDFNKRGLCIDPVNNATATNFNGGFTAVGKFGFDAINVSGTGLGGFSIEGGTTSDVAIVRGEVVTGSGVSVQFRSGPAPTFASTRSNSESISGQFEVTLTATSDFLSLGFSTSIAESVSVRNVSIEYITQSNQNTILIPESGTTAGQDALGTAIENPRPNERVLNLTTGTGYATVADSASLDLTTEATWELWGDFSDATTERYALHSFDFAGAKRSWGLMFGTTYGASRVGIIRFGSATGASQYSGSFDIGTGIKQILATYNAGTVVIYINGLATTLNNQVGIVPTSLFVTDTGIRVGATFGNTFNEYSQIGDIRIYDRALTADEITKNYNARKSAYGL